MNGRVTIVASGTSVEDAIAQAEAQVLRGVTLAPGVRFEHELMSQTGPSMNLTEGEELLWTVTVDFWAAKEREA